MRARRTTGIRDRTAAVASAPVTNGSADQTTNTRIRSPVKPTRARYGSSADHVVRPAVLLALLTEQGEADMYLRGREQVGPLR